MVLFLTKLLLDEKTQLSKVWLAAHWDKKLSRYHIYQIDIESTVRDMMSREIILDLRLSGHLLVGIVRIFSRKTMYLLNECSHIFTKVRVFRSGITDLPEHRRELPFNMITLPEAFTDFDDLNYEKMDVMLSSHQSHVEDITLKETCGNQCLLSDEDFNDNCDEQTVNQIYFDDDTDLISLFGGNEKLSKDVQDCAIQLPPQSRDTSLSDMEIDNINDVIGTELINGMYNENYNHSDEIDAIRHISETVELISVDKTLGKLKTIAKIEMLLEPLPNAFKLPTSRKKRKSVMDEVKKLDKDKIDKQFKDTSDITVPLDLAPPSKRLMLLKEIGGADDILHLPGLKLGSDKILNLYKQHLKLHKNEKNIDFSSDEECPYGSMERCESYSGFPDDEDDKASDNLCDDDMDLNVEFTSSLHTGVRREVDEQHSQSINFTNEFQQEMSFSNGMENTPCILQDKIAMMLKDISLILEDNNTTIKFSVLVQKDKRIKVARKFLFLLMLRKFEIVELYQEKTYGEIFISRGINFIPAFLELCKK